MANALRKFWPTGVLFFVGLGVDLTPFESESVAYVLWALAALWALYAGLPQIRRIRVGLAPPDAELQKAKEAQKRLFAMFKKNHEELVHARRATRKLRDKVREAEQEREQLRAEKEALEKDLEETRKRRRGS